MWTGCQFTDQVKVGVDDPFLYHGGHWGLCCQGVFIRRRSSQYGRGPQPHWWNNTVSHGYQQQGLSLESVGTILDYVQAHHLLTAEELLLWETAATELLHHWGPLSQFKYDHHFNGWCDRWLCNGAAGSNASELGVCLIVVWRGTGSKPITLSLCALQGQTHGSLCEVPVI